MTAIDQLPSLSQQLAIAVHDPKLGMNFIEKVEKDIKELSSSIEMAGSLGALADSVRGSVEEKKKEFLTYGLRLERHKADDPAYLGFSIVIYGQNFRYSEKEAHARGENYIDRTTVSVFSLAVHKTNGTVLNKTASMSLEDAHQAISNFVLNEFQSIFSKRQFDSLKRQLDTGIKIKQITQAENTPSAPAVGMD